MAVGCVQPLPQAEIVDKFPAQNLKWIFLTAWKLVIMADWTRLPEVIVQPTIFKSTREDVYAITPLLENDIYLAEEELAAFTEDYLNL